MTTKTKASTKQWWILLTMIFLLTCAASAQQEPVSPKAEPQEEEQPVTTTDEHKPADLTASSASAPEAYNPGLEIQAVDLETGQTLSRQLSPVRWGRFSLISFEALQAYDSNFLFRKIDPISAQAGAIQGLLMYTIKNRLWNFDLQYRPQLWVSTDQTVFDGSSNLLDLHTFRYIAPRWALNLDDQFHTAPDRGLGRVGFTPNFVNGTANENPFLGDGRRFTTNLFTATLNHDVSARDRTSFLFRHQYVHLSALPSNQTGPQGTFLGVTQQQNFGGEVAWVHNISRDHAFGVHYAYDREYFQGFEGSAQLHGILFSYWKRLRPSWMLRLSGGPALMLPATPKGATASPELRKTYQLWASISKSFRRSGILVSYSRNHNFTGQISDNFNDRLDASFSQRLPRRFDFTVGGSYVRQNFSAAPNTIGRSAWAEVDYHLSPSWSLYTTYNFLGQSSSALPFGPRNLVTTGIRWSWDFYNRNKEYSHN